ncbi:MAG: hypothetical protein AB2A00_21085 [Myxococcota bacterium]
MTTVTRSQFWHALTGSELTGNDQFRGCIDLNNMSPQLSAAFAEAGVGMEELKALAGPDQIIRGDEFMKLFNVVDRYDVDTKSKNSFRMQTKAAEGEVPQPTLSGKLFEALKAEVNRNLGVARLNPGKEAHKEPLPVLTLGSAQVVPERQRLKPVSLGVPPKDQFEYAEAMNQKAQGNKFCFKTAEAMVNEFNHRQGGSGGTLNGPPEAVQIAYMEDTEGRVVSDALQAQIAQNYIDKCLDAGRPVIAGVSYKDDKYNTDHLTDHFVVIDGRGYDDAGRIFYEFKDPATSSGGRFYVDGDTGKLFKAPEEGAAGWAQNFFEVTQVRTYRESDGA